MIGKRTYLTLLLGLATSLLLAGTYTLTARAADMSRFDASNIMDDSVMSNKASMTEKQIQTFLDSKNQCKKNPKSLTSAFTVNSAKTEASLKSGSTTYRYHLNNGKFVCLADQKFDGESAAKIIYQAAQKYTINPQVLIVLLEKEQGLISDSWPNYNVQYRSATGYGCPDTAACDTQYYGFKNQVNNAANFFRAHLNNDPCWNKPHIPGSKKAYWITSGCTGKESTNGGVLYHPNSSCGATAVNIKNRATSGLYSYTPYQPNKAALNAGYGTGNSCSSYGNRNYWGLFTDWFGSTQDKTLYLSRSLWISPSTAQVSPGLPVSVSFVITNKSSKPIAIDSIGVAVRDSNNKVVNFPFVSRTLAAGESYEYYQQRTFDTPGQYKMWIANRTPSGDWSRDWPYSTSSSIVRDRTFSVIPNPDITLSRSLYFSRSGEYTTEDLSASSFVVKNNESKSVTLNELFVEATHASGQKQNFPSVKNITLKPGEEYEYHQQKNLNLTGSYTVVARVKTASGNLSSNWPQAGSSVITQRDITINAPPDVRITRDLWVSPNPVLTGQPTGASFIITNNETAPVTISELAVRAKNNKGSHRDFPSVKNIVLQPGEEYEYHQQQSFRTDDTYTFWVSAKVFTDRWSDTWPKPLQNIVKNRTLNSRLPNVSITRNLWESPTNARSGDAKSVSFIIKNNENRSITLPSIGVAVRDPNNNVVNFPFVNNLTLSAGESYEYYQSRIFDTKGKYRMWIANYTPTDQWSTTWPYSASKSLVRERAFTLR